MTPSELRALADRIDVLADLEKAAAQAKAEYAKNTRNEAAKAAHREAARVLTEARTELNDYITGPSGDANANIDLTRVGA